MRRDGDVSTVPYCLNTRPMDYAEALQRLMQVG